MHSKARRWSGAEWLIVIGSLLFIFILALSAWFEADIRWLHFFQSWMYVATIVLALRGNRWGWFVGFSAAAFWDYCNLFVTSFFSNGLHWLSVAITSGRVAHVDQIIAVPAWIGNFLVVAGCGWAYARAPRRAPGDAVRLLLAFALTSAFFAADMALFQPRYLGLFPRALHPHLPFVGR